MQPDDAVDEAVSSKTKCIFSSHVPPREPSAATVSLIAPDPLLVATVLPDAPRSMISLEELVIWPA